MARAMAFDKNVLYRHPARVVPRTADVDCLNDPSERRVVCEAYGLWRRKLTKATFPASDDFVLTGTGRLPRHSYLIALERLPEDSRVIHCSGLLSQLLDFPCKGARLSDLPASAMRDSLVSFVDAVSVEGRPFTDAGVCERSGKPVPYRNILLPLSDSLDGRVTHALGAISFVGQRDVIGDCGP